MEDVIDSALRLSALCLNLYSGNEQEGAGVGGHLPRMIFPVLER
jgi:hypothetical protein